MNDLFVLLVASGFGAVAWLLLLVSDWLMGETTHGRK